MKRAIAFILYYSGILWLYALVRLRNRAVVLMYHRVLPADADTCSDSGIVVTPRTFDENMRFLRRHFSPLTASEFQSCLDAGRFPRRACLVTFDDGWYDNEVHALPILQRHAVPAVVFIATGYVGTADTFWQERMTRQLLELSRCPISSTDVLASCGLEGVRSAAAQDARPIVRGFVTRLKARGTEEISRVRAEIEIGCRDAGIAVNEIGDDRFMNWAAVARLESSGYVTIGSHAHSHIPLPRLGASGAMVDVQRSLELLRERRLPAPSMMAYPNGDYDTDSVGCLSAVGMAAAFTTESGAVAPYADRLRLPRVNVHEGSASNPAEFLCRVLGVF